MSREKALVNRREEMGMSLIEKPLDADTGFGARVAGVTRAALGDAEVRRQISDIFERRGVLVFEDMEPTSEMQLELSSVFGALRNHAMNSVPRENVGGEATVMVLNFHPGDTDLFEVGGKTLSGWIPWHYDACYARELYRGAVLRAIDIPPEGGLTGFADGIQLYQAISPELRERFEHLDIVYHPGLMFMHQRFGLPRDFSVVRLQEATRKVIAAAEGAPRAIHPAIWTRKTGEKVLHVSPWQAAGIAGHEDAEGDALLEALCQEIYAKMRPYWHRWSPTDMVVWDNWRTIHSVSGHDPAHARRVHRATIAGDYGLGRMENDAAEIAFETMA
jgi:taurine dioxygenase